MNFSLSDLVPPLRWSDAATIPLLRDQPDLPDAWWRSLPMSRVLDVLGPERLAEILAGIALRHWPAAAVGDVLPALHVLDPEEADEPCTAIALDRTGSWPGLLALTGHDLRDQPFIQPIPLLNALFTAAFARLVTPAPASPVPAVTSGRDLEIPEPEGSFFEARAARDVTPETGAELHESAPAREPETPDADAGPAPVEAVAEHREIAPPEVAPALVAGDVAELAPVPATTASPAVPEPEPEAAPEPEAVPAPASRPRPPSKPRPFLKPPRRPRPTPPRPPPNPSRRPSPSTRRSRNRPTPPSRRESGSPPDAVSAGDVPKARWPAESRSEENLHALLDGVFANVEDKRWAVAQNRLFSDAPAAPEALANLFAVPVEVIQDLEIDLRRQLKEWLASDEAAPYRDHLDAVKKIIGKAAPRERLINAADWHGRDLHSLDVPAWQFVLATLPDYHLVDEWLVEGDIAELRHRTRSMISSAKSPLTINKALDMVSSLGIHPEVSKEWLENVPQLRILGAERAAAAASERRVRSGHGLGKARGRAGRPRGGPAGRTAPGQGGQAPGERQRPGRASPGRSGRAAPARTA
ncbi:hypothetical protein ACFQX6_50570 [Streptosporangium lutulentum]